MKIHPGEVIGLLAGLFLLAALIWGRSWTAPQAPPAKSNKVLLQGQLWGDKKAQRRQGHSLQGRLWGNKP